MADTSVLFPLRNSHWPLASFGDSLRSASEYDPSFYKITASALGLKKCEILHVPLKVSVSYNFPEPWYASFTGLQCSGGLIFLMQYP